MKTSLDTVRTERFEMDYAVFGTGSRTMVILPGMSLHPVISSAASVASFYAPLCDSFTIYLIDRRKNMPPGYSVADMADDTAEAMRILGIASAYVFGTSQGGMVALTIATEYPELVEKLALSSTIVRQSATSRETMSRWAELADAGDVSGLNRDIFRRVYSPSFYERFEAAFARLEGLGTEEELRQFGISARATLSFDIRDRLYKVKCPVLAIGVDVDSVLGGQGTRDISERLGCEFFIYPGTGHAVYDEDRHFPERILDFFVQ